jgi:hypothetical protein
MSALGHTWTCSLYSITSLACASRNQLYAGPSVAISSRAAVDRFRRVARVGQHTFVRLQIDIHLSDLALAAFLRSARWTFIFGFFWWPWRWVSGGFENRQPVRSQIQPPGDAGLTHWLCTSDQIPTLAEFWLHSVMPKDSDC